MNRIQKSYDSYDKTNQLLKLTNSYYHYRNLELIKNRKSQYEGPKIYEIKRQNLEPYANYYVKQENNMFFNKLSNINSKPVVPNTNQVFIEKEGKIKDFRRQNKYLEDMELLRQNKEYKKRVQMQQAFVNSKSVDKEYAVKHTEMLHKLKNIGENESIVLPPIKNGYENPITAQTNKYYMKSEANKSKASREEVAKNDSAELRDDDQDLKKHVKTEC